MDSQLREAFLTNTDETGRFFVTSERTGKTYAVEPIGFVKTGWGDLDSSYQKVSGDYGKKYTGAITEKESLITEENGFINIETYPPGTSPLAVIEAIDAKYPDKG